LVRVVLIICPCAIIDVTDMGHSDIIFGLSSIWVYVDLE